MEIEISQITKSADFVGKKVFICDFRRPDLDKKPIRHVQPTEVIVVDNSELPANKRVYYSQNHFAPLKSNGEPLRKVIAPFDNTGYRSFTGTPVKVFDNLPECVEAYNEMAQIIIKEIEHKMSYIMQSLTRQRDEILKMIS